MAGAGLGPVQVQSIQPGSELSNNLDMDPGTINIRENRQFSP